MTTTFEKTLPPPMPRDSDTFLPPASQKYKSGEANFLASQNEDRERMVCAIGMDVHYELNVVAQESGSYEPRLKPFNPRMSGPACPYNYTGRFVDERVHEEFYDDPVEIGRKIAATKPYDEGLFKRKDPRLVSKTVIVRDYGCKIPIDLPNVENIAKAVLNNYPDQYVAFLGEFVSNLFGANMRAYLTAQRAGLSKLLTNPDMLNRISWGAYRSVQGGRDTLKIGQSAQEKWEIAQCDATLTWSDAMTGALEKLAHDGRAMTGQCSSQDVYDVRPCIEQHIQTLDEMITYWCRGFGSKERHVLAMLYWCNEQGRNLTDDLQLLKDSDVPRYETIDLHVPINFYHYRESYVNLRNAADHTADGVKTQSLTPDMNTKVLKEAGNETAESKGETMSRVFSVGAWSGNYETTNIFVGVTGRARYHWGWGHPANLVINVPKSGKDVQTRQDTTTWTLDRDSMQTKVNSTQVTKDGKAGGVFSYMCAPFLKYDLDSHTVEHFKTNNTYAQTYILNNENKCEVEYVDKDKWGSAYAGGDTADITVPKTVLPSTSAKYNKLSMRESLDIEEEDDNPYTLYKGVQDRPYRASATMAAGGTNRWFVNDNTTPTGTDVGATAGVSTVTRPDVPEYEACDMSKSFSLVNKLVSNGCKHVDPFFTTLEGNCIFQDHDSGTWKMSPKLFGYYDVQTMRGTLHFKSMVEKGLTYMRQKAATHPVLTNLEIQAAVRTSLTNAGAAAPVITVADGAIAANALRSTSTTGQFISAAEAVKIAIRAVLGVPAADSARYGEIAVAELMAIKERLSHTHLYDSYSEYLGEFDKTSRLVGKKDRPLYPFRTIVPCRRNHAQKNQETPFELPIVLPPSKHDEYAEAASSVNNVKKQPHVMSWILDMNKIHWTDPNFPKMVTPTFEELRGFVDAPYVIPAFRSLALCTIMKAAFGMDVAAYVCYEPGVDNAGGFGSRNDMYNANHATTWHTDLVFQRLSGVPGPLAADINTHKMTQATLQDDDLFASHVYNTMLLSMALRLMTLIKASENNDVSENDLGVIYSWQRGRLFDNYPIDNAAWKNKLTRNATMNAALGDDFPIEWVLQGTTPPGLDPRYMFAHDNTSYTKQKAESNAYVAGAPDAKAYIKTCLVQRVKDVFQNDPRRKHFFYCLIRDLVPEQSLESVIPTKALYRGTSSSPLSSLSPPLPSYRGPGPEKLVYGTGDDFPVVRLFNNNNNGSRGEFPAYKDGANKPAAQTTVATTNEVAYAIAGGMKKGTTFCDGTAHKFVLLPVGAEGQAVFDTFQGTDVNNVYNVNLVHPQMFAMLDAAGLLWHAREFKNPADCNRPQKTERGQVDGMHYWCRTLVETFVASREIHKARAGTKSLWESDVKNHPEYAMPASMIGYLCDDTFKGLFPLLPLDHELRDDLRRVRALSVFWGTLPSYRAAGEADPANRGAWMPLSVAHQTSLLNSVGLFDNKYRVPANPWLAHNGKGISRVFNQSYHSVYHTDSHRALHFQDWLKNACRYQAPDVSESGCHLYPFSQYGGTPVAGDFIPHVVERFKSNLSEQKLRRHRQLVYNRFGYTQPLRLGQQFHDTGLLQDLFSFEYRQFASLTKEQRAAAAAFNEHPEKQSLHISNFMAYARNHAIIALASVNHGSEEPSVPRIVRNLYRLHVDSYECMGTKADDDGVPVVMGFLPAPVHKKEDRPVVLYAGSLACINSKLEQFCHSPANRAERVCQLYKQLYLNDAAAIFTRLLRADRRRILHDLNYARAMKKRGVRYSRPEFNNDLIVLQDAYIEFLQTTVLGLLFDMGADLNGAPLHLLEPRELEVALHPEDPNVLPSDYLTPHTQQLVKKMDLDGHSLTRTQLAVLSLVPPNNRILGTMRMSAPNSQVIDLEHIKKQIQKDTIESNKKAWQKYSEALISAAFAQKLLEVEGPMDFSFDTYAADEDPTKRVNMNAMYKDPQRAVAHLKGKAAVTNGQISSPLSLNQRSQALRQNTGPDSVLGLTGSEFQQAMAALDQQIDDLFEQHGRTKPKSLILEEKKKLPEHVKTILREKYRTFDQQHFPYLMK